MFDKPEFDAYRQTKAPPQLKERVMAMADETPRRSYSAPARFVSIAAAAACLLLVIAGAILLPQSGQVTVALDGQSITSTPLSVDQPEAATFAARLLPPVCVNLSVSAKEPTDISVSAGRLEILSQRGELIASGTDLSAAGELTVLWTVELPYGTRQFITIDGTVYCAAATDDGCVIYLYGNEN